MAFYQQRKDIDQALFFLLPRSVKALETTKRTNQVPTTHNS